MEPKMNDWLQELEFIGDALDRAECVLTTSSGEVFCSDHHVVVSEVGKPKLTVEGVPKGFLPNGIALLKTREFLVANLDPGSGGGVWKVDGDRKLAPWLLAADGEDLRITNFVGLDHDGRIWVSVSTRHIPRELAFKLGGTADGFIVMVDHSGARIVADGLGFTNECRVDPEGGWLYVNETFARRLSRFRIRKGSLGAKEIVCEFSDGDFPDGLTFDSLGGAWVTCVVSNRIIRVAKDGEKVVALDASDRAIVEAAERRYADNQMGRADVDSGARSFLGNVSSLAFGGADLRRVYLGTLENKRMATYRCAVAGAIPPHWHF